MLLIYIIFRTFRTNTSTTFHYQTVHIKNVRLVSTSEYPKTCYGYYINVKSFVLKT
jgi:hypothetical protein